MRFKEILRSPTSKNQSLNGQSPLGNDERSLCVARVRQKTGQIMRLLTRTSIENPLRLRCLKAIQSSRRVNHFIDLCWCREGESNPQGTKYRRILSPLRLPVPPSRL
jgi:hypothetical protein